MDRRNRKRNLQTFLVSDVEEQLLNRMAESTGVTKSAIARLGVSLPERHAETLVAGAMVMQSYQNLAKQLGPELAATEVVKQLDYDIEAQAVIADMIETLIRQYNILTASDLTQVFYESLFAYLQTVNAVDMDSLVDDPRSGSERYQDSMVGKRAVEDLEKMASEGDSNAQYYLGVAKHGLDYRPDDDSDPEQQRRLEQAAQLRHDYPGVRQKYESDQDLAQYLAENGF